MDPFEKTMELVKKYLDDSSEPYLTEAALGACLGAASETLVALKDLNDYELIHEFYNLVFQFAVEIAPRFNALDQARTAVWDDGKGGQFDPRVN